MALAVKEHFNQSGPSLATFSHALKNFCENEFGQSEDYFAVIYGSYAYGIAHPTSDVDLMIVAGSADSARMKRCVNFVKDLHQHYNLPQDTEIKYEHKVLIPVNFMHKALSGAGFQKPGGGYCIPQIVKTRECLESEALRLRFLLALMTHKHAFVSGSPSLYNDYRTIAGLNLIQAVATARNDFVMTPGNIHKLLNENGEESGELYLGFKDNNAHQSYLAELSCEISHNLRRRGLVMPTNDSFPLLRVCKL